MPLAGLVVNRASVAPAGDLSADEAAGAASAVRAMTGVLGVAPLAEHWHASNAAGDDAARHALGSLLDHLLAERSRARAERDFARADAIRDQLTAAGVALEDTADGPTWTLKDGN